MITFKKDLATFVPANTEGLWDALDVELGVQLRDTFGNNSRLVECVTEWHVAPGKTFIGCALEISIISTYQRMPSKVRTALENDIKDTLKEVSKGFVVMSASRLIVKIN